MDNVVYTPLPGRGFGPFRRDRLWLAEDHLLSVRSSRIVDLYERFYFTDIEGIYFRDRRGEHGLTLSVLLIPCFILVAFVAKYHWAWLIPLVPLAAWTVAYGLMGRQAECHIQTLLGTHVIPAISRRPAYEQLLERIVPLVEAAQGRLDPAEFELIAPRSQEFAPPPMETLVHAKPPLRGWYFEATFLTVAVAGFFSIWNQRAQHGMAVDWVEYGLSFAGLALIIVALARAYRVDVGGKVLGCLWSIVSVQCIYSLGAGVVASIRNASSKINRPPSLALDPHPIRSVPELLPYATAIEGLCIALAVVGLALVIDRKNRQPA